MARAAEDLVADALRPDGRPPLAAAPTLLGLGVALPGPLDHARGVLHRVTGFPEWDGFPLRDELARRLAVPVVVDKDTNAAALGLAVGVVGGEAPSGRCRGGLRDGDAGGFEAAGAGGYFGRGRGGLFGPGQGGSFGYLHLGTGLGAGLVIGGSVHRGPVPGRRVRAPGRPAGRAALHLRGPRLYRGPVPERRRPR